MGKLLIFNFTMIAVIALALWLIKRYAGKDRTKNILLLAAAVLTILLHYSSLIFKLLSGDGAMEYLGNSPNLLLPVYPCNVVMWSALIFACLKNKSSRLGSFLADFLFWFGIISSLVGMFANVDFIKTPTLADYEIVKSIAAHATILFNVILIAILGYVKIDVRRNITNIIISIFMMGAIGFYCNLVFSALISEAEAYEINSMFLIHSPFDGIGFLTYPVISLIAVPVYLVIFIICDKIAHKKG